MKIIFEYDNEKITSFSNFSEDLFGKLLKYVDKKIRQEEESIEDPNEL